MLIDENLVRQLVIAQFPQWKALCIRPVATNGWDNRTFHLGQTMSVRLPNARCYEAQVEKEHRWLPRLAPLLPFSIPEPVGMGLPAYGYPCKWSIYRWLEGDTVASLPMTDLDDLARNLARFLLALQQIDPLGGPQPGADNFYRGGSLMPYGSQVRKAVTLLKDKIDVEAATEIWDKALETTWQQSPVWVHGDISPGNLLMHKGRLSAIIDFGQLSVGDPACDLVISWTLFAGNSRKIFQNILPFDSGTWARARAWALWKALIVAAGLTDTNAIGSEQAWLTISDVLREHNLKA